MLLNKAKATIIFLDQYPGLSGGQTVLRNIIESFSKDGYRSIAVLPEPGLLAQSLDRICVEVKFFPIGNYSIGRKTILDFFGFFIRMPALITLLTTLIKRENAQLVYANGARTFVWATLACSITKTPLFWHLHSIFTKKTIQAALIFFGKFKIVKRIFVVSSAAALPLKQIENKLEIIYNAVKITSLSRNYNILKEENNLLPDDFLIGCVGILENWKNQEDLVYAAKYIRDSGEKNKRFYFFIIGDSLYKNNQRYKDLLKSLVVELHLENDIIFTGFRNDMESVMNSLDILALCSKDPDPCPMVTLEAASLGTAIISTNLGGTKEIFKENESALFYEPGDSKTLADKIIYLSRNPRIKDALAKAAQIKIINGHNLDNYLRRIKTCVEMALYGN